MRESWKTIVEHPNYQISNMGNVRNSKSGKFLNPYDDGKEYLRVKTWKHQEIILAQAL